MKNKNETEINISLILVESIANQIINNIISYAITISNNKRIYK